MSSSDIDYYRAVKQVLPTDYFVCYRSFSHTLFLYAGICGTAPFLHGARSRAVPAYRGDQCVVTDLPNVLW